MKIFSLLATLLIFVSCSTSTDSQTDTPITIDKHPNQSNDKEAIKDSVLYIDKIQYFSKTNEFYVELMFKEPTTAEQFTALSKKADSLIYEEDEMARYRLPLDLAKQALELSKLDSLNVYNEQYEFITNVKFKRVEYLSDVINDSFIAVFAPDKPIPGDQLEFYSLGTTKVDLKKIHVQEIQNNKLTQKIISDLSIKPEYIWVVKHIEVQPYNSILSLIAFNQKDGKTYTYLTEFKNNKLTILKNAQ